MGPARAIKTCLVKAFRYSGRASRAEFWWFALFALIATLAVPNSAAFLVTFPVGVVTGFKAQQAGEPFDSNIGLLALQDHRTAFVVIVCMAWLAIWVPMLAAITRRLHDMSRRITMLFSPLLGLVLIFAATITYGILRDSDMAALGQQIGSHLGGVFLIACLPLMWFLSRPSTPGPNKYGPNPLEVTP